MATFHELIRLIQNGDPVDAGTINRVLRQMDGNTKYVLDLLEAALIGSTVFARSVTVEPETVPGAPVYYNATSGRFERALAAATIENGELKTAESSQVWGVVHTKHNSTSADVLLTGYTSLNISAAIDGQLEAGLYYVSSSTPGKLTRQQPPITVPVLQSDGDGNVFVNPRLFDAFLDHKHYKFDLVCLPAGDHTPPSLGDRHTISNPDTDIEGWLPANHASFSGKAPAGAAFGYNLAASSLNALWPPVPLSNAYLEWDKGELKDYMGMGVPLGADGLAILDANGIWWMSDCYSDVPWPTTLDTSAPASSSSSASLPECPRDLAMRLTLWFSRMSFMTSGNVVTSLQVADGSENFLSITCAHSGAAASSGDLEITFNQDYVVDSATDTAGHIVFKSLTDKQFKRGPVVEGLTAGSSNVYLSSTAQDGDTHQGMVDITVITDILGNELPVQLVRLSGVTEENYLDVLGLGLPPARNSSYRARFEVPADISGVTALTMKIRLRLLAITAGSFPDLDVSFRRIPRPSPTTAHTALPTTDTALTLDLSAAQTPTPMGAEEYLEVETSTFTVSPGDIVFFSVTRNGAGGDGYAGEMHVIDQRPVITNAT